MYDDAPAIEEILGASEEKLEGMTNASLVLLGWEPAVVRVRDVETIRDHVGCWWMMYELYKCDKTDDQRCEDGRAGGRWRWRRPWWRRLVTLRRVVTLGWRAKALRWLRIDLASLSLERSSLNRGLLLSERS